MTLSDLERRGVRSQIFLADLHNYARAVCPKMTDFSTPSFQRGGAPASPKFLGTPPTPKLFDLEGRNTKLITHVGA